MSTVSVTPLPLGPGVGVHASRAAYEPGSERVALPQLGSLPEILIHQALERPDQVAYYLLDIEERLSSVSYGELLGEARRVATGLRERGVLRGERVVLCMDTGLDYLASFFGCGLLGAVPVPLYPPGGPGLIGHWRESVERVMRQASSRAIVVDGRLKAPAIALADRFEGGTVIEPSMLKEPDEGILPPPISSGELAFVQYTSGTTSLPKGVMIPHAALLANVQAISSKTEWTTSDLVICWLPLYHDMGLVGCTLGPFCAGLPVVLLPPMLFLFRPRRWLWAFHHFRGTLGPAPNFAYALCVDKVSDAELEGLDLTSWRVAYNGAEFIHSHTIRRFTERYAGCGFSPATMYPVYGMAETTLAASFPAMGTPPRIETVVRSLLETEGRAVPAELEDPDSLQLVGVGQALLGHELLVVDQQQKPLPDRRQGEILLRGPSLFSGYLNDAEATRSALRDGWFHTGDLGFLDGGDLFVCGRIKDVIIKSGRNIHPYDVELAAESVEGVRAGNVAAFGVFDAASGTEELVVALESHLTNSSNRDLLQKYVEHAIFKRVGVRPRRVLVLPPQTLPKTSSGKISRSKLRQLHLEAAVRPGGRRGHSAPRSILDLAGTYLRVGVAWLRLVPGLGRLVDHLLPKRSLAGTEPAPLRKLTR